MYSMHMKFAVFGVSGAGKSTLIDLVRRITPNVTVHKKDTTRPPRNELERTEGSRDLEFVSEEEFKKRELDYDVVYSKYNHLYGIKRDQLIAAFERKEVHFIIVSDITAIQRLKFMYPDMKAIYIHVDPNSIPEHLQKREGVDFEERVNRIRQGYTEFIENSMLFDHVVLNFWDRENAVRQVQNILHYYVRRAASNL